MSGRETCTALFPSRISASHGPTPAAVTRTTNSLSPGVGHGISSMTIALGWPKEWILPAFMFSPNDTRPARGKLFHLQFSFRGLCSQDDLKPPARSSRAHPSLPLLEL